ncbi:MAG: TonB-dependent receptor [Opitutaceae bacterium]|nr:TonB-dependent receptor [Opitutaceae bacterium]
MWRSVVVFALAVTASLCLPLQAQSGNGTITGRVLNEGTGRYLKSAEIEIAGTQIRTISEADGTYTLLGVPAGEVKLVARYAGLDTLEIAVTVAENDVVVKDINLTSAEYTDAVQLSEFVVAGTKEGNAQAIVDQKQSVNVKNSIAADAFGSVAEDNVGEFLKYVPGLSLDYVENDARTVRVRGMGAKYATVMIDGNPVAAADIGIATGRNFQFEQVSLSGADSIDVNKSPMADMPANSLSGTVNVKSRSAFDQKGRRINYTASLTMNDQAATLSKTIGWDNEEHYKTLPNGNISYSDTIMDGRLGIVASVNHTGTYVEQKILAALNRSWVNPQDDNKTEVPRVTTVNWQDGLKPTFRDSFMLNLDYKATENVILSLRTSYNLYDAPFHNRNWTFGANSSTNDLTVLSDSAMRTTAASAGDTTNSITIQGSNLRKYGGTFSIAPALAWKVNENVKVDAGMSYSRSYQLYDSGAEGFFNVVTARMNGVSWGYTSTPGQAGLQMVQYANRATGAADTRSIFDITQYNSNNMAVLENRDAKDQVYSARADVTVKLPDAPWSPILKFGLDTRTLVKDIETWQRTWSYNVGTTGLNPINLALYKDPYTPEFAKGQSFTDLRGTKQREGLSLDKWALYEEFLKYDTDPFTVHTAAEQPFFMTAGQVGNSVRNKVQNMRDFQEDINSAYVMGTFSPTNRLKLLAGLRFEATDAKGKAFDDIGHARTNEILGITGTSGVTGTTAPGTNTVDYIVTRYGTRTWKTQSYDDLFPSLQARYEFTKDWIGRASYYRSILRPDPENLARSLTAGEPNQDTGQITFSTANPDLQPEYADNFDFRVEYYFSDVGSVSAGFFYKFLYDAQVSGGETFTDVSQVPQDIIDLGYDPADLVANQSRVTWTINGSDQTIWGFEADYSQQLTFLPQPLNGTAIWANVTYTHPDDLELFARTGNQGGSGITELAANWGINYTYKKFFGSIKFNWLDDRLLDATGWTIDTDTSSPSYGEAIWANSNAGVIIWEKARTQIDLNFEYKWKRSATFFLNVANLTGTPSRRFYNTPNYLQRHGAFGAKWTFGIKGTF